MPRKGSGLYGMQSRDQEIAGKRSREVMSVWYAEQGPILAPYGMQSKGFASMPSKKLLARGQWVHSWSYAEQEIACSQSKRLLW